MTQVVFSTILGLCFGSFANVVVYRLPRGESVAKPSSYCPSCKVSLKWRDLLPVVSFLLLRGKCRYCKARIAWRYPAVEVLCAVLFVVMGHFVLFEMIAIPLWAWVFALICLALIDYDTLIIPDSLLIVALISGVGWLILTGTDVWWAFGGMLAGGLPLLVIDVLVRIFLKKPGFGFGDVKLMAVCGLFLGVSGVVSAYFIAFVAGGLYGGFLLYTGKARTGGYFAFAPFLCVGVVLAFLQIFELF